MFFIGQKSCVFVMRLNRGNLIIKETIIIQLNSDKTYLTNEIQIRTTAEENRYTCFHIQKAELK